MKKFNEAIYNKIINPPQTYRISRPASPPYGLCTSRRDVFFELRSKFVILKIFQIN